MKIFTEEQVKELNEYQKSGRFHPYTCGRNGKNCEIKVDLKNETRDWAKDGVLIATTNGWVCPCGEYTQDWAHGINDNKDENKLKTKI